MNHEFRIPFNVLLIIVIICCNSCTKDLPVVTTANVSSISTISAISGGNITNNGGAEVTARGICWSTVEDPTISSSKTSDGTGNGSFTSSITGLTANTKYYVRAYATNSEGTGYGNEVDFTSVREIVTDADGNVYNVVHIGTQLWMKENLKTTRYKDGSTTIPLVSDNTLWSNLTSPGYCWYNNDANTFGGTYGTLYNWYAVSTGNLCPYGWHVPSDADWTTLTSHFGGMNIAGGKLKEAGTLHWSSPNIEATNETGFTALPAGYRSYGGDFTAIGTVGAWWSSNEYDAVSAGTRGLRYDSGKVDSYINGKMHGFSVRCIKD